MHKNNWMLLFERLFALDYSEAFGKNLRVKTAIVLLLLMKISLCNQPDFKPTK